MPDPIQPTPASAWAQAAEGELYTLPGSGHIARLRQVSLVALAAGPGVPNPILRLLAVEGTVDKETDQEKMDAYKRQARAFLEVAALALVEPRLVLDREPDPAKGEIGPQHLADQDLLWIYYDLVGGRAARLATFRAGGSADPSDAPGERAAHDTIASD